MPNWCKCNLKIVGNGEKVLEVLELLKDENGQLTFSRFLPTPEELDEMQSPVPDTVTEEEKQRLIDKYGATDWYSWRIDNWGVKWDASDSSEFYKIGDDWRVSFQTPWGPPIEFFQTLSKEFKNMTFYIQYADESERGAPIGEAVIEDGLVMYDGPEPDSDESEEFGGNVWDEEWNETGN